MKVIYKIPVFIRKNPITHLCNLRFEKKCMRQMFIDCTWVQNHTMYIQKYTGKGAIKHETKIKNQKT